MLKTIFFHPLKLFNHFKRKCISCTCLSQTTWSNLFFSPSIERRGAKVLWNFFQNLYSPLRRVNVNKSVSSLLSQTTIKSFLSVDRKTRGKNPLKFHFICSLKTIFNTFTPRKLYLIPLLVPSTLKPKCVSSLLSQTKLPVITMIKFFLFEKLGAKIIWNFFQNLYLIPLLIPLMHKPKCVSSPLSQTTITTRSNLFFRKKRQKSCWISTNSFAGVSEDWRESTCDTSGWTSRVFRFRVCNTALIRERR